MTPAASDADLLAQARQGDEAAFTELFVRHQAAAQRLANTYAGAGNPEQLLSAAFQRILAELQQGSGPSESFRAHLFVTLRRLAAERAATLQSRPVDEVPRPVRAEEATAPLVPADRQLVLAAYETLPDRWQAVLWHTAVEGRQPADLAPSLGMSANAAAALAYRAREKLRQAYLQAHERTAPRPECQPHRGRLGAYVRDGLSRRDRGETEQHLDGCGACRGLVAELADVKRMLVRALLPAFRAAIASHAAPATGDPRPPAGRHLAGGRGTLHRPPGTIAWKSPAVLAATVMLSGLAFAVLSSGGGPRARPPEAASPPDEHRPFQQGATGAPGAEVGAAGGEAGADSRQRPIERAADPAAGDGSSGASGASGDDAGGTTEGQASSDGAADSTVPLPSPSASAWADVPPHGSDGVGRSGAVPTPLSAPTSTPSPTTSSTTTPEPASDPPGGSVEVALSLDGDRGLAISVDERDSPAGPALVLRITLPGTAGRDGDRSCSLLSALLSGC